jgi:hypothetical protein
MDTNQPTIPPVYSPASSNPGMFGTKIPSTVAFAVGILLFLMPFVDVKCNNVSLQKINGVELATGFQMKNKPSDNSFMNDLKSPVADEGITKATTGTDKKDPNLYALAALLLGALGLILSLVNAKTTTGAAMITGVLSAGAMIGLLLDIKKQAKIDVPNLGETQTTNNGLNLGDMKMGITVDFTPWFYISLIAFLAAAFFCYKRMQSSKR